MEYQAAVALAHARAAPALSLLRACVISFVQLATLEAEFGRRDRAGQVKWGEDGLPEDRDSRRLKANIISLQKVLLHDERESDLLTAREDAFLRQAISNYGR
jgi:hypothetical protein